MCSAVNAENRERLTLRKWLALLLPALAIVALVPAYLLVAPASDWSDPLLLAVLLALAVVAIRHDVPLPSGISFDATTALALIAVALAGPLPALAVILPPIAVNALTGREKLIRPGNLANLAAYGWYTFGSAVFIQALAPAGASFGLFAVLVGAGAILLVLNWALSPAIYATLWLGHPMRVARRDVPRRLPDRHGHGRARRADRPALRLRRPPGSGAVRPRRPRCRRAR